MKLEQEVLQRVRDIRLAIQRARDHNVENNVMVFDDLGSMVHSCDMIMFAFEKERQERDKELMEQDNQIRERIFHETKENLSTSQQRVRAAKEEMGAGYKFLESLPSQFKFITK